MGQQSAGKLWLQRLDSNKLFIWPLALLPSLPLRRQICKWQTSKLLSGTAEQVLVVLVTVVTSILKVCAHGSSLHAAQISRCSELGDVIRKHTSSEEDDIWGKATHASFFSDSSKKVRSSAKVAIVGNEPGVGRGRWLSLTKCQLSVSAVAPFVN